MKQIVFLFKVLFLSFSASCLMYILFIIRGVMIGTISEFINFILEFMPMLFFVILLSMWHKHFIK